MDSTVAITTTNNDPNYRLQPEHKYTFEHIDDTYDLV